MGILVPIIGPIKHLRARGPKAVPGPTFPFRSLLQQQHDNTNSGAGIAISKQLETRSSAPFQEIGVGFGGVVRVFPLN